MIYWKDSSFPSMSLTDLQGTVFHYFFFYFEGILPRYELSVSTVLDWSALWLKYRSIEREDKLYYSQDGAQSKLTRQTYCTCFPVFIAGDDHHQLFIQKSDLIQGLFGCDVCLMSYMSFRLSIGWEDTWKDSLTSYRYKKDTEIFLE